MIKFYFQKTTSNKEYTQFNLRLPAISNRLKILFFVFCLFAGMGITMAQTNIFVGTGTVTPSVGSNPGSGANGASPYGYCTTLGAMGKKLQIIYTATDIGAAMTTAGYPIGTSYIHNIAFDVSTATGAANAFNSYTIKMANVAQTNFANAGSPYTGSLTTVYGPSNITYTAGTGFVMTFTLPTPFQWDGTSSLLVEVCYTASTPYSLSSYGACRRTNTAANQMLYTGGASINCATTTYATAVTGIPNARLNVSSATPCSGAPALANVVAGQQCMGSGQTLTLSGLTGASGYTYLWKQSSASGGPYTNASGINNASTYTTPGALPFSPTYYLCEVTCSNSGLSTLSNYGTATYANFLTCYCTTDFSSAAATTARGLRNVTLTGDNVTINNNTVANTANPSPYNLYATPVADLTSGLSYNLLTTVGTATNNLHYVKAWIDYDHDGRFGGYTSLGAADVNGDYGVGGLVYERIAAVGPTTNVQSTSNFTVPAVATLGNTAMRVRYRYGASNAAVGSCVKYTGSATSGGAGEVEDYRVNIIAGCTAPNTGASAGNVSPNNTTTATLNWTSGNGDAGRIVVLRQGAAVNAGPVSGNSYTANAAFGSGQQIGTGNYVVYNATGSNVPITNLLPSTTYHYAIYEYNSLGVCYINTAYTGSFTTTSCAPSTQASGLNFTCYEYDKIGVNFNRGNGTHVIVLAKAGSAVDATPAYNTSYTANVNFGGGSQIGSGNYVLYNGNDPGSVDFKAEGLAYGTTYHFAVFEYNASPNCYTTAGLTGSRATRNAGTYTSSTTTQVSANANPNMLAAEVVSLQVVVAGGTDPAITMNSITFNTTGTTNTGTDLINARVFYTGTSNTFASATQFGTTFTNFSGNLTANGNMQLSPGTNYFWIAYDLNLNATINNKLDATIVSFNLTDLAGSSTKTPSVTNPAGNRNIVAAGGSYCSPVHINSVGDCISSVAFAGTNYTGGDNCGNYGNYTALPAPTVNPGSTYTLSYDASDNIGNTNSAYIDWNRDGTFGNSAGEQVTIDHGSFTVSLSVTVPVGAVPGNTRLRIVNRFPSAGSDPCIGSDGSFTSGVTSDFLVIVAGGGGGTQAVSCGTSAPTVSSPVNYMIGAGASQLAAVGAGLKWYTAPTGGTGSGTAPTPSTATAGTTMYYVSQTSGCEGPRAQIAVYVEPNSACPSLIIWTGALNTDWHTLANWNPNTIPTASSTVQVPNTTNKPVISAPNNGNAGSIEFLSGATLTILGNQMLSVKKNWIGNSTAVLGSGRVIFDGSSPQTITGATSWPNLRISNAAGVSVVSGQQTVNRALELNTGTFTTNNNLVIASNNTVSGFIDNFTSGFTGQLGAGEHISYTRLFAGGKGYRFVSSPIESGLNVSHFGSFVTGNDNFRYLPNNTPPTNFPTCWIFDESWPHNDNNQKGWYSQTTSGHSIVTARGYALLMPANNTVTLTGTPAMTNKAIAVSNSYSGFNLIGNPFPAPVDWQALRNTNTAFIGNTVQFFQATGTYAGQYRSYTYNGISGFGSDLGGGEYVTNTIQPMQAMFVQASGGGSFAFNAAARIAVSESRFFEEQPMSQLLRLRIHGGTGADESMIVLGQGTDDFNIQEDAVKLYGMVEGLPNIYTIVGAKNLMVNELSNEKTDRIIPVGVLITKTGSYSISVAGTETFDKSVMFVLEDRLTGTFTDLRVQNQMEVVLPTGTYNNRFFLHLSPPVEISFTHESCHENDASITLKNPSATSWSLELNKTDGSPVRQLENLKGEVQISNLEGGDYLMIARAYTGYYFETAISLQASEDVQAEFSVSHNQIEMGYPVQFNALADNHDYTYHWDFGDGYNLEGEASIEYVYDAPGIYTVRLIVSNGICKEASTLAVTVLGQEDATGISLHHAGQQLLLYPNPASDIVTLQLKSTLADNMPVWIELRDAAGRLISREYVKGMADTGRVSLPVSHLRNGAYFLIVETQTNRYSAGFSVIR